jgi:hypothetical protein
MKSYSGKQVISIDSIEKETIAGHNVNFNVVVVVPLNCSEMRADQHGGDIKILLSTVT